MSRRHTLQGVGMSREGGMSKLRKANKPKLSIPKEVSGEIVSMPRGQGKDIHGLTYKQGVFAQNVANGMTLRDSYRHAYDAAGMSAGSINAEAQKLMDNPAVTTRIDTLARDKLAKVSHDATRIRTFVIERLHVEAHDPDNPPSVRVRALELLGKLDIVGAFRDRIEAVAAEPPASDLAATLEARLRALLPSPDKA